MEIISIIEKYFFDLPFWLGAICGFYLGYKYALHKVSNYKNSYSYTRTFYCQVLDEVPTNVVKNGEFISTNCPYHKTKKILFFKRHICAKTGKKCDAPEFV